MLDTLDSPPTNADVQYAFKQISPEKAGVLATLGFAWTSFQMRNLATRTNNLHFEAEWFNHGGDFGSLDLKYSRLDWGCWLITARASPASSALAGSC